MVVQILRQISSLIVPPHLPAGPARLRPLKFSDLRSFVNLFSDRSEHPLLWREIPTGLRKGISILGKDVLSRARGTNYLFAIELDGKLTGIIGFRKIHMENYAGELVVFIKKEFRNKGIAFDAFRKVLDFGFYKLGLNRIYFYVDPRNETVRQMVEKHKPPIVEEGILRQNEYLRGSFVDDIVYSILREDWLRLSPVL